MSDDADISVRAATPEDLGDVVRLVDALNELHGDPRGHFDRVAAERDLFGPNRVLSGAVAQRGAASVGVILWCFAYESAYAARGAYVSDIFIEESARGLGLGQALLAHAAARVKAEGGVFLWWTSADWNDAARGFYTRLGASDVPVKAHALTFEAFDALAAQG